MDRSDLRRRRHRRTRPATPLCRAPSLPRGNACRPDEPGCLSLLPSRVDKGVGVALQRILLRLDGCVEAVPFQDPWDDDVVGHAGLFELTVPVDVELVDAHRLKL